MNQKQCKSTNWHNTQDDNIAHEIGDSGDYLIKHGGHWYYWIGGSPTNHNHGPYDTKADALINYRSLCAISGAARALRAIPSARRSEQSRINGRKGGRPRKKLS